MIKIKEEKISNGLPVVLIQNSTLHGIQATLFVRSGSAYESKETNGISHLLEHLIFNNRLKNEAKKFFPVNLELDAWTRKDFTCYEISHHKKYFEKIIKVLSACVNNFSFSSQELNDQKEIIIQEINERKEDPFSVLEAEMDKFLYKDFSLSREVSGTKENLKGFSLNKIKNWYENFYFSNNIVLSVSGNFDFVKGYNFIEKKFSQIKNNKKKTFSLTVPEYNKNKEISKTNKKFEQIFLGLAFPVQFKFGDKKYFQYLLLAEILDKTLEIARKNKADFYDLNFYFHHYLQAGEMRLITSTEKNKAESIEELIKQLQKLDFSLSFFEKIKDSFEKQFSLREDNIDDLNSLTMYKISGGKKILTPQEEVGKIRSIEYNSLKKIKEEILKDKNCYKFRVV